MELFVVPEHIRQYGRSYAAHSNPEGALRGAMCESRAQPESTMMLQNFTTVKLKATF